MVRRLVEFRTKGRGRNRKIYPLNQFRGRSGKKPVKYKLHRNKLVGNPSVSYDEAKKFHRENRSLHAQKIDEALIAKERFPEGKPEGYSVWRSKYNRSDVEGIDVKPLLQPEGPSRWPTKQEPFPPIVKPIPSTPQPRIDSSTQHPFELTGDQAMVERFQPIVDEKFADLRNRPLSYRKISIKPEYDPHLGGTYSSSLRYSPVGGQVMTSKPLQITINERYFDEGDQNDAIVHEGTHFRRHVQTDAKMKKFVFDKDKEEKETVHETTIRAGESGVKNTKAKSYYAYPESEGLGSYPEMRITDLTALGLHSERGITDTDKIENAITSNQDKTILNKVRIARTSPMSTRVTATPPENVDTYFVTSEGDYVHFYSPRADVNPMRLAHRVDRMDRKVGEENVYEYRDGKPYLMVRRRSGENELG